MITPIPFDSSLLDSRVLSRIGHLELVSQRLVDGVITGRHRSKHQGGVCEFAEHRDYSAGDEVRLIDWKLVAKSDRYYIKRYEEETNLQVMMILDTSGSMGFGLSTLSKFDFARVACACLSRLILRQRDSVGLALIDQTVARFVPPRANAGHLQALCDALRHGSPGETTSLADGLLQVARRIRRRGIFMVWTDAFTERGALMKSIQHLRQRGHEVVLMHVLAPEETSFQFDEWSQFECLETESVRIKVDPASVRKRYLEQFGQFLKEIKQDCLRLGCEYRCLQTDEPLGEVLAEFLHRRMALSKS
ncbi:DUF58 domain-containing protein [Schlesneria paludicola]|uniref:DUF58 domain-containing protein n=1 Tax=Schlesneria paludicola TaxID=360056 RepID=UPI00031A3163|nr:DUF58 domain-containing protein [Schlesneria paludicola]